MSDLLTASVLFAAASVYAVCFSAVVALVCVGVARLIPWVKGWRSFWATGMICASLPGFMALVPHTPTARAPGNMMIPSLGTVQWVPFDLLVDASRDVDWWLVLCQVWLCLYLIVLCVKTVAQFRAHFRVRRLIAASARLPEDVAEVVWEAVGSSKHRRRLEVVASAQADSPFVAGFFRCVLVLPRRILEVVNRDQLVFVIKHELAHVDACDTEVIVGSEELAGRSISDFMLSAVAMKFTVSNNVVIASGGRTLAISAGQQSRILSTKLACFKFEQFMRLQHAEIVDFVRSSRGKLTDRVAQAIEKVSAVGELRLERGAPILMASDGFIPFKDNIEEASRYGIEVVCEPVGALRSNEVELAAANHGLTLVRTQNRFFYH